MDSALSKACCRFVSFKCRSSALLCGSPRAWSSALLKRRLVDPVNAQAVEKFFIPFILSACALHKEQFKLITQSDLFLSALITSHSLARCVARAVAFQPLAAVTDNLLGFLVDGGVDVDVDGNFSRLKVS